MIQCPLVWSKQTKFGEGIQRVQHEVIQWTHFKSGSYGEEKIKSSIHSKKKKKKKKKSLKNCGLVVKVVIF